MMTVLSTPELASVLNRMHDRGCPVAELIVWMKTSLLRVVSNNATFELAAE